MSMNWRLASRLSVITMAILVIVLVTLLDRERAVEPSINSEANTNPSGLQGTDLGSTPAPDFTLADQFGKQVSLSQFKGKPVVLTFLYTHCPDICPLTAEKLHSTLVNLGDDAQGVAVLAVSTDPRRDTMDAALSFSKTHNMQGYWHFLIGSETALSQVWSSYNVFAQSDSQSTTHTLAVYVIDKQGRERVYLGNDFTIPQLTTNLKILLKE